MSPVDPCACAPISSRDFLVVEEVGWLSPMAYTDYVKVSANIANRISDTRIRSAWNRLTGPAIEEAVAGGLGMRIFEELMLSALLDSYDREEPAPDALNQPEI